MNGMQIIFLVLINLILIGLTGGLWLIVLIVYFIIKSLSK